MTFNLPLAVSVLALIEDSQSPGAAMEWDQSHWGWINDAQSIPKNVDLVFDSLTHDLIGTGTCGTAMCFAGWALSQEGVKLRWTPVGHQAMSVDYPLGEYVCNYTEDRTPVEQAAAERLGITKEMDEAVLEEWIDRHDGADGSEFPILFYYANDLDDLYMIVASYAEMEEADLRTQVQEHISAQAAQARERLTSSPASV